MSLQIEKVLKKAVPTVRTTDQVVKNWEITVMYKDAGTGWNRDYTHQEDVEYLELKPEGFTKEQLIGFMPSVLDAVFESHYLAANLPPSEEKLADFNLSKLS